MNNSKYIDPIIGTVGDVVTASIHGGGKTHPGAVLPGGMVQLSPDTITGGDNGTGYNYVNNTIEGFSFNHMSGVGWYGDLGNLQIMPIVGETDLRSGSNKEIPFTKGTEGWKSEFSHENEIAKAGYYSIFLDRYKIKAEATATMRTGILRFTYPESKEAGLIFNFSRRIAGKSDYQYINVVSDTQIEGHIVCNHKNGGFGRGAGNIDYDLYFCIELSKAFKSKSFFANEELVKEDINYFENEDAGLILRFDTEDNEQIEIVCGISYTDIEGARNNFKAENMNFDSALLNATKVWDNTLECVKVEGTNETDLTLFYTCLYHSLLDPRTSMDADGRFKTAQGDILKADYTHRTMFSGWDVYRSEFPLLTLIRPDIVNDEVNSLLNIAIKANSSFPKWELMGIDSSCMCGDPGLLVYADAYIKGIRNFDNDKAFEIAMASGMCETEFKGKPFVNLHPNRFDYKNKAYWSGHLSYTLELLLADFAMYKLCDTMGKKDEAEHFLKRAMSYSNNYNKEIGFLCPRDEKGNFLDIKNEYDETGCVESNIYQQSWFVPSDIEGLSKVFGKDRFIELLERFFRDADFSQLWNINYNHSNEPCHNITHYFNILNLPKRTQYWTRRIQKEAYRKGAYGFCGNEDVGQISAWYVLSALGFAQVCIADPKYYFNTPLFKKATIKLNPEYHNCKTSENLTIICDKDPLLYPYISEIYFNGEKINESFITFDKLTSGGTLLFNLTDE